MVIIIIIYVCAFYGTGREEYLTEAVIFWNRRKICKLPNLLVKRLAKAHNKFYIQLSFIFLTASQVREKALALERKLNEIMLQGWGDSSRLTENDLLLSKERIQNAAKSLSL